MNPESQKSTVQEVESGRTEKILEMMESLNEWRNKITERIQGQDRRSNTRAHDTMSPAKDNFLLGIAAQFNSLISEGLIKNPKSIERVKFFLAVMDNMREENSTRRAADVDLEQLSPKMRQIAIAAREAGVSGVDYINSMDVPEQEKREFIAMLYKEMSTESEISQGTVPQDVADRRLAHLTDLEDFIKQTISFLAEEI